MMDDLFNRIAQLERGVSKMFQAPTVPIYDMEPPPPPPPGPVEDGQMRADMWHYTLYCDGQMVFDHPEIYQLSPPDNGFTFSSDWTEPGGRVYQPIHDSGVNMIWSGYPSRYVSGMFFNGGSNWFHWIRNAYWDGTLLQTFQGGGTGISNAISPFVDPFGSWRIRPYSGAGGGRAAQGDFSFGLGLMWLNDNPAYHRSTQGVTYVAQCDVSTYHMGFGNIISMGTAIEAVNQNWTPWGGYSTPTTNTFAQGIGIILPLIDGTGGVNEGSPHPWFFGPGNSPLQAKNPPTAGPGHAITMNNSDGTFHTIKIEVTYNGHQYPRLHYVTAEESGVGGGYFVPVW